MLPSLLLPPWQFKRLFRFKQPRKVGVVPVSSWLMLTLCSQGRLAALHEATTCFLGFMPLPEYIDNLVVVLRTVHFGWFCS